MLDPYRTLHVSEDASPEEIKGAYRKLAKQLHPDLHPDDPTAARRFKDVTAAYDTLSNAKKRRSYDLKAGIKRPAADPNGRREGLDMFRRAWGFRAKQDQAKQAQAKPERPRQEQGRQEQAKQERAKQAEPEAADHPPTDSTRFPDLYQTVEISFIEAARGGRRRLSIGDRLIDLAIPPLTEDGQTLRLRGQGGMDGTGQRGDAYIQIKVLPHHLLSRDGYDIYLTLPVSIIEAVKGASVTVPTLHGMVQLKIPPGSNTDTALRLRGKGLQSPNGPAGDQLVVLKVILPDRTDPDFAELVSDWAARHSYAARPVGWEVL